MDASLDRIRADMLAIRTMLRRIPTVRQMQVAIIGSQVAFAAVIGAVVFSLLRHTGHG